MPPRAGGAAGCPCPPDRQTDGARERGLGRPSRPPPPGTWRDSHRSGMAGPEAGVWPRPGASGPRLDDDDGPSRPDPAPLRVRAARVQRPPPPRAGGVRLPRAAECVGGLGRGGPETPGNGGRHLESVAPGGGGSEDPASSGISSGTGLPPRPRETRVSTATANQGSRSSRLCGDAFPGRVTNSGRTVNRHLTASGPRAGGTEGAAGRVP